MLNFYLPLTTIANKEEHREFTTQHVWRQTSTCKEWVCQWLCWHDKQMRVSFCSHRNRAWFEWHTDRTDKRQRELWEFWGKCDLLLLAENKSTGISVNFSDDYCNDTNDRGYAAFHDCKKRILQHRFVKQDCKKTTALENEAVFVVTSWASEDISKHRGELEFLSC